jgi:hypothetical protein
MANDLLLEDYKLKLSYLTTQYDRMWTRFNFLLGTELAVFGFLGYVTFDAKIPEATTLAFGLGLAISALWYVIGAQDRALVDEYRDRANAAAEALRKNRSGLSDTYEKTHAGASVESRYGGILSWYYKPISITKLPAVIAALLFVTWLILICPWRNFAEEVAKVAKREAMQSHGTQAALPTTSP